MTQPTQYPQYTVSVAEQVFDFVAPAPDDFERTPEEKAVYEEYARANMGKVRLMATVQTGQDDPAGTGASQEDYAGQVIQFATGFFDPADKAQRVQAHVQIMGYVGQALILHKLPNDEGELYLGKKPV